MQCLGQLEPIAKPSLSIECREMQMPRREHPELKEAEIARNWPSQLEHYRKAFHDMKQQERPSYQYFFTGIRISDDFAIVTNASELFCEIGMSIKTQSPFKHTMVAELTNGAHGYVPTAKAFAGGSYETWFGEHSYLTTRAGEIIENESLDILNYLKRGVATTQLQADQRKEMVTHESVDHYPERDRCRCECDSRGDCRRVQDPGDQQSHGAVHHRGTTRRQGAHVIALRRSGWPCDWAHRLRSRDHFGRHSRNWYGLGPVSVLPAHQQQGIGKALIREGLARLKDMNAQGCCLVGHPEYYRTFGFKNTSGLV